VWHGTDVIEEPVSTTSSKERAGVPMQTTALK